MTTIQADDSSWTIFEKLLLMQSVYKYGDNWLAISRTMKQNQLVSHPAEFFTQKNCTTKYNTLVDPLKNEAEIEDEHKKRSGEYVNDKQRMPWTAKLARKLYHDRIQELKSDIASTEEKFRTLVNDIDEIKSGKWDYKFSETLEEQRNKKLEENAEEVSKTLAEVSNDSTEMPNIKIEPSVIITSTKVESVMPVDVDKSITSTITEKEIVNNENVESLIEADSSSTAEDMKIDIVPYILQSQAPATSFTEQDENLITEQNMVTTVAANMEVQKEHSLEEENNMMDVDDEKVIEKPIIESLSVPELELTLETGVSTTEQAKKMTSSPSAESVTAEGTPLSPQTVIGGDAAMDLCEQEGVEIVDESSEKGHFAENLVSSPASMEGTDATIRQEDVTSKEQYESNKTGEIDNKEIVKGKEPEISETTSKPFIVSTKEETLDTIKSAESLSPIEQVAETKIDEKEDTSEVKEDAGDVRMADLSEGNEEDKYSSRGKVTPTPQAEFKEPSDSLVPTSPAVIAATPSNAQHSTSPEDLIPPTPTLQYDTAPTPSGETSDDKKLKTWQKLVSMMLHEISNHRFASVFQNPIREQDAPGYYDIVKQPMDLRTLKKRLREGTIHDTNLFHRDLMLMFMNASVFNREDTDIHQMALEMKDRVEAQISDFRRNEGSGGAHEPATRRKSMAIDAHEAAYITNDGRIEGERATSSSHRGKFKDDTADQRPTKKTKRSSISKKSERDI